MTTGADTAAVAPLPVVVGQRVTFRYDDPDRALAGVRLWQELHLPAAATSFRWADGVWRLEVEVPAQVDRFEYLLELYDADGGCRSVVDPANPRTVGGAFGDHSVVELAGYAPPTWLAADAPAGSTAAGATRSRHLPEPVGWRLWSPAGLSERAPAPLLLVHDGPEYADLAGLTRYLAVAVAAGTLPPLRAALLVPGSRDDRYAASPAYSRALALDVLPALRGRAPGVPAVGLGASLGALAMLHVHRRHPHTLDGLFLQSGSFFTERLDRQERQFRHFGRVARFVEQVLGAPSPADRPVPVTVTCGLAEENHANNRVMARALARQGYDVAVVGARDLHNYTAWRDCLHPHLAGLLRRVLAAAD